MRTYIYHMYVIYADMRVYMTISAYYRAVTIATGMNGPACLYFSLSFPSTSFPLYVDAHAFVVLISVRSDRDTEAFPYFIISLIWFSDCNSGSQSIGACSFRMFKMLKYLFLSEGCLVNLSTLIKHAQILIETLDIINKGI